MAQEPGPKETLQIRQKPVAPAPSPNVSAAPVPTPEEEELAARAAARDQALRTQEYGADTRILKVTTRQGELYYVRYVDYAAARRTQPPAVRLCHPDGRYVQPDEGPAELRFSTLVDSRIGKLRLEERANDGGPGRTRAEAVTEQEQTEEAGAGQAETVGAAEEAGATEQGVSDGALYLMEIVSEAGRIFHFREDDWLAALESRATDVTLCDEFGRRFEPDPDQPRLRIKLRVSFVAKCAPTRVTAWPLVGIEEEPEESLEAEELSDYAQFPSQEVIQADESVDFTEQKPAEEDRVQETAKPKQGGSRRRGR